MTSRYGETPGQRIRIRRKELKIRVPDLAAKVGMAPTTLYELENGRQGGTTKIHLLCVALGLQPSFVENGRGARLVTERTEAERSTGVAEPIARYTLYGMQVTSEEIEFGIEWGKLDEPWRGYFKQQVMLKVAEQKRAERNGKKKTDEDHPHEGDTP